MTEAGKVENYRFLENVTMDFGKKLELRVILGALSDAIRKFPVETGHVR